MAQRTGYLLVDHRNSPGLPEDVARASGYDPALCKEGKKFEADTFTCSHCKGVLHKNPLRTRPRAECPKCNFHYICDGCAAAMHAPDYVHMPFEKFVDLSFDASAHGRLFVPVPSASPKLILPANF
jgi:hypothetical protein